MIPEVLDRLRRALGHIGKIERHGDLDDFKWLVEGDAAVQKVLDAVSKATRQTACADIRTTVSP